MTKENPGDIWEEFLAGDTETLALPDFYSSYFDYSFDRTVGNAKYVGLRLTGEFAYARYMSFNIYDAEQATSYGARTDFEITPLPGNVNPFVAGSDAEAKNRNYSITVQPRGYSTAGQENVLNFNSEKINVLTVMLRYYVPQDGTYGNVPLPKIEAFDVRTGTRVAHPTAYPLRGSIPKAVMRGRLAPVFSTAVDDTLRFYHAEGTGQFNNADNMYLIAAVKHAEDEVLLIRIKPPSYPRNNNEYGKTDVRYWSFNEGDADTSTPFGKRDEEFDTARDGFVYIAIGGERIQSTAKDRGYNFMPWKAQRRKTVILYRNMVTRKHFIGSLDKVPVIEPKDVIDKQNLSDKEAKNYIGDYAPIGRKISQALFMRGDVGPIDDVHNITPPRE